MSARVRIKDLWAEQRIFLGRSVIGMTIVFVLCLVLVGQLVWLQVFRHDYFLEQALGNQVRRDPIPASRGLILDRHGTIMVDNQPTYQLELIREQIAYRDASKRCSLWRIDREDVRIAYLLDLPSNGDTCFASMLEGANPDEVILYNYSSDPNGPELTWVQGQEGPTNIYRHVLRFTRR